jgi:hypothetical protein
MPSAKWMRPAKAISPTSPRCDAAVLVRVHAGDSETQSRSHLGLSLQLSNINSIEVLANVVFGISAAERHISTPWAPSVLVNIAQAPSTRVDSDHAAAEARPAIKAA